VAEQGASLVILQAQVEVLTIVVHELCLAMPPGTAGTALAAARLQLRKLAETVGDDEAEETDEARADLVARTLSALSVSAARQ
jgi:hypothetical protein